MANIPILTAITAVFTAVFTWLQGAIQSVMSVFWDASANSGAGELTIMGTLAIIALGISIFFLLVGLISNFLHLRG